MTADTLEVQLMRDIMQTWSGGAGRMLARHKRELDDFNASCEKALVIAVGAAKRAGLSKSAVARATGVRNWKRINKWWEDAR